MNREEIFYEVFRDVPFSFYSVDLGRLSKALLRSKSTDDRSHIVIPLPASKEERVIVAACLRGFINGLRIPGVFTENLIAEQPIKKTGKGGALLNYAARARNPSFKEVGGGLVWEESGFWPIAYSSIISQFIRILDLHRLLISSEVERTGSRLEEKGFARENACIVSEYPRHLPTRAHYAAASLGAWLGGAINVQYFSLYATIRQIHHSELNRKYLDRIGYNELERNSLDSSGFIAIHASLLGALTEAQGELNVFGSISINEQNAANPPSTLFITPADKGDETVLPGLVVDKYYRAPFWARRLGAHGVYGAANVLRDHYEDFYSSISSVDMIRCKHYCAPIIEVSSVNEIHELVKKIPKRHESGILFRGQRRLYTLPRDIAVKRFLFADSCNIEPSLITSASRDTSYEYDSVHFALKHFVEKKIYAGEVSKIPSRLELWRKSSLDPVCKLDFAIMALAQHYGLPSNGLDVTTSDDVAIWFATNSYEVDESTGVAKYSKMQPSDWPENPEQWPVVFICQMITNSIQGSLHHCHELGEFGFEAKRPNLQQAQFFLGGHSDHQNRLAETVVCAFRLKPGFYKTNVSFDELFPSPDEDPAYRLMLQFADEYKSSWGRFVNRFHAASEK